MDWESHNKWAYDLLGISEEVANGVNNLIDDADEPLSAQFKQEKNEIIYSLLEERKTAEKNSILGAVVAKDVEDHDVAREQTTAAKIYAEVQLRFLQDKGEDYVKAWYLHHHLDYLSEERNSGKQFDQLLSEYRKKYPQTHSQEIEDLLIEHEKGIKDELGI